MSGRTSSGGAFKGYRIYKTADGGWTVPELDSSVFEDKTQAKRFISEWTKRRGNPKAMKRHTRKRKCNPTTYGTSYFTSRSAAIRYYSYEEDPTAAVARKIREGQIRIGKPPIKSGQRLTTVDGGARYAITESNPRAWKTITARDVGKYFEGFGNVLGRDVGKKYYIEDGSHFVENDEQMARRLGKSNPKRGGMVKVLGHTVRVGTKKHAMLVDRKKHASDLQKSETGLIPAKLKRMPNGTYKVYVAPGAMVKLNPARRNGSTYATKGVPIRIPRYSFTPKAGQTFYIGGKTAVIKRVDTADDFVYFTRAVDGTTGMSIGNLYQASYVPETSPWAGYRG